MTKNELLKLIDDEVSSVLKEPLKEPVVQKPVIQKKIPENIATRVTPKPNHYFSNSKPKTEEEIDEDLFYAGKKNENMNQ